MMVDVVTTKQIVYEDAYPLDMKWVPAEKYNKLEKNLEIAVDTITRLQKELEGGE